MAASTTYHLVLEPLVGASKGIGSLTIDATGPVGQGTYSATTGLMALSITIGEDVFTLGGDPATTVVLEDGKLANIQFSVNLDAHDIPSKIRTYPHDIFTFRKGSRLTVGTIAISKPGQHPASALPFVVGCLALGAATMAVINRLVRRPVSTPSTAAPRARQADQPPASV